MKKEFEDELLYMLGEKIDMEDLQEPCEYHSFTESYEERKNMLRKEVRKDVLGQKTKKNLRFKRWASAAAVLLLVCGVSVGGYAYYRSEKMDVVKDDKEVLIYVNEDDSETTENITELTKEMSFEEIINAMPMEGVEVPKVSFEPGYIPEGYAENPNNKDHYQTSDEFSAPGFWILQEDRKAILLDFVSSVEEKQINNMQAILVEPQETDLESIRYIFLFNPEDLVSIMIGSNRSDLSMDELVKIAENLSYKHTEYTMLAYHEDKTKISKREDVYLSEEYFVTGNVLEAGAVCNVEITDIALVDSVNDLEMSNFYSEEEVLEDTDETGLLIDERIPLETRIAETADKKLMLVTMNLTNTTTKDIKQWSTNSHIELQRFEQEGIVKKHVYRVGTYAALGAGEWCYLEGSDYTSNEEERTHSFMCVDIPKGETKTITMGIVVYADELDCLYLGVSPQGSVEVREGQLAGRQYIKLTDLLN